MIMDNKFYVSLEAAMLLKEKGYNEECTTIYDCVFKEIIPATSVGLYRNECMRNDYYCSAPTKAEAIDWLESKGIVVEIQYRRLTGKYFGEIHYNKMRYKDRPSDLTEDYKVRLEAEEAAINTALELL
jgi:hypothetical protein